MYNLRAKISSEKPMEHQLGTPVSQFDGFVDFLCVVLESSLPSPLLGQVVNLSLTATKVH